MRLGDVIEIKHGYAFNGEHIIEEDNSVVLVTPGNFRIGGGFQEKKCKFFDGEIPQDYVLKAGDFIVTMTDLSKNIDTLGYSAWIPKSEKRIYLHNQRIGLVSLKNNKCDRGYIYWLMRTHAYQRTIANTSTGSTVHHTSPSKIYEYECDVPDIRIQHRIATILSRYDSLIENYQKQIKLLEEAAQRLYKEWFVDLHFPGHENTKIVDGVPEGWKEKSILEVFDFKYGKILPTKDFVEDGPIPVYGASKQIGRYTKANCFEPKVLIGSRGNAGFVHRTIEDETYVTNNSFIVEPCAKYGYLKLPFIFESFKVLDFVAICTGAAQPQLTLNSISSLKYIVPIKDLIVRYCGITTCYFSKIALAYKQIHLLTEARDRLLPKLMSGEIDV